MHWGAAPAGPLQLPVAELAAAPLAQVGRRQPEEAERVARSAFGRNSNNDGGAGDIAGQIWRPHNAGGECGRQPSPVGGRAGLARRLIRRAPSIKRRPLQLGRPHVLSAEKKGA